MPASFFLGTQDEGVFHSYLTSSSFRIRKIVEVKRSLNARNDHFPSSLKKKSTFGSWSRTIYLESNKFK